MSQQLTENFLIEIFKSCLSNRNVLEVIDKHLEFNYLPDESHKKIWKGIKDSFQLTNKCPTIGILNEKFKDDQETLDLLVKIKKCKIPEVDNIFPSFERFIKEIRFIALYEETGKQWNSNVGDVQENQDKAIKHLSKESEAINSFSLKEGLYSKVFSDFEKRQELRLNKDRDHAQTKVSLGIHALDYYSRGGIDTGTSALFLGRSGTGKSTLLRWMGINAARAGLRVVHFQIESTEEETMNAYDAAWTSVNLEDIEFGGIPKAIVKKVHNIQQEMVNKGSDIFVICPGQFDSLSVESCRDTIEEIEKKYGKVSLALFDNLELFTVKGRFPNSEMGERKRREDIANKITNIAINYNMACAATTQANDVRPDKFNNPDFVLTRSDINEFKNLIKPFSFFASINQTADEYEQNIARIYVDKMRKYKSGQIAKICQSLDNSRFYDSKKTLVTFWDAINNKPL